MDERIKIEYRLLKHRQRVNIIAAKARRLAQDEAIINIRIDKRRRRAGVEPNVSMEALVTATLKHGLIPIVVPEFTGITVGGAFSDIALESSSFRYGHFEKCVTSVEVLLGNGNIVTASPIEKSDLFSSLSGACGTLGIWTIIETKLVPARQFVEIKYFSVHSAAEALNAIKDYTATTSFVDFVDGIMFGPNGSAVIIGTMTDGKKSGMPVARFSRAHDPWFALYVHESVPHVRNSDCKLCAFSKSRSSYKSSIITELVPIKDYLFRYDRAAFWTGMCGRNPNVLNGVIRFMLNPLMKAKSLYAGLYHSGQGQSFFIQDITLPEDTATRDLGGTKMLYATNYYTEEEFWRIHDKEAHDELRDKWGAAGLPSLWEKLGNPNPTYKEKSSRFKVVMKTLLK
ncbi:hypothetical protein SGCOL_009103 [Colletotrichum sp. CLE4]